MTVSVNRITRIMFLLIFITILALAAGLGQIVSVHAEVINLIDQSHEWKPVNDAKTYDANGTLHIVVSTTGSSEIFNRAVLQSTIKMKENPLLLSLDYASRSYKGAATFYAEIRGNNTDNIGDTDFHGIIPYLLPLNDNSDQKDILWHSTLGNTEGHFVSKTFILPSAIGKSNTVEFRLYIITSEPGQHDLIVKNALLGPKLEDLL